jgi:hypothetical protein
MCDSKELLKLNDIQYMVEDFVRIGTWKDTLELALVVILCDKGFIASSISR